MPFLKQVVTSLAAQLYLPAAELFEWLERHTQIRMSILLTCEYVPTDTRMGIGLHLCRHVHGDARVSDPKHAPHHTAKGARRHGCAVRVPLPPCTSTPPPSTIQATWADIPHAPHGMLAVDLLHLLAACNASGPPS